jgi:hypothetical protein
MVRVAASTTRAVKSTAARKREKDRTERKRLRGMMRTMADEYREQR